MLADKPSCCHKLRPRSKFSLAGCFGTEKLYFLYASDTCKSHKFGIPSDMMIKAIVLTCIQKVIMPN